MRFLSLFFVGSAKKCAIPIKGRVAELRSSATLKIKSNTMKNTHTKVYLIF